MGFLFGGKPETPKPPPVPKQPDETEANAANAERIRRLFAGGKSSTMLTGDTLGSPAIQRKTALGV